MITNIQLWGDWDTKASANIAEQADEAGQQVIEWGMGRTDVVTPEMSRRIREILRSQDRHKTLLEKELRRASADLQSLASAQLDGLRPPADSIGDLARRQYQEARYETAMYAAQRLMDAVSQALADT